MVRIIFVAILLIILLLIFSPFRIFVDCQNEKINIVIKYLFFQKKLQKRNKKNLKNQKNKECKNSEEDQIQNKSKIKKIIPKDTKGKIEFVLNLLNSGGKAVKHITKHISIKKLYLDFIISDLDAYECALKFGKANIVVYNTLSYLSCFIRLKKKSINIKCIYNQPECSYNLNFIIKFTPAIGISALVVFIFTFLVNNKNIKKQNQYEPQS